MTRRVLISLAAKSDLENQAIYIGCESPGAASRFLDAAERVFRDLSEMPSIGAIRQLRNPRLAGLRSWRIPGFDKHIVFYRVIDDGIEIVRVLHGARDVPRILENETLDE